MTDQPAQEEVTFEEALQRLDAIVHELEEGTLPLDDAIARFEAGLRLLKACRARLDSAELRVRELLAQDDAAPRGG